MVRSYFLFCPNFFLLQILPRYMPLTWPLGHIGTAVSKPEEDKDVPKPSATPYLTLVILIFACFNYMHLTNTLRWATLLPWLQPQDLGLLPIFASFTFHNNLDRFKVSPPQTNLCFWFNLLLKIKYDIFLRLVWSSLFCQYGQNVLSKFIERVNFIKKTYYILFKRYKVSMQITLSVKVQKIWQNATA